jgi:hypothetical protein
MWSGVRILNEIGCRGGALQGNNLIIITANDRFF